MRDRIGHRDLGSAGERRCARVHPDAESGDRRAECHEHAASAGDGRGEGVGAAAGTGAFGRSAAVVRKPLPDCQLSFRSVHPDGGVEDALLPRTAYPTEISGSPAYADSPGVSHDVCDVVFSPGGGGFGSYRDNAYPVSGNVV